MPDSTRVVAPGPDLRNVRTSEGLLSVPEDWILVPPGDAALTRRIKAAGPCWLVQEKKGRRTFSQGIWAPAATVESIREALQSERADPAHARRREADAKRRDQRQVEYVESFRTAVRTFLAFHPRHAAVAEQLAVLVTDHATPVGSGTVARTERISLERRAEAAVIAWLRHHTTAYDRMTIARVKGERRQVRRMLAEKSRSLLAKYRAGHDPDAECALRRALETVEGEH